VACWTRTRAIAVSPERPVESALRLTGGSLCGPRFLSLLLCLRPMATSQSAFHAEARAGALRRQLAILSHEESNPAPDHAGWSSSGGFPATIGSASFVKAAGTGRYAWWSPLRARRASGSVRERRGVLARRAPRESTLGLRPPPGGGASSLATSSIGRRLFREAAASSLGPQRPGESHRRYSTRAQVTRTCAAHEHAARCPDADSRPTRSSPREARPISRVWEAGEPSETPIRLVD
jgi:hypothetical protein